MSVTDFPSLCKDKNNLANNVLCELYFFANVVLFPRYLSTSYHFSHFFIYSTSDIVGEIRE